MQEQSVQEMIYAQMDHFLSKSLNENNQVSLGKIMEIASWVSAYVIRQRHVQNGSITEEEMQVVLGTVGNFCHHHFQDNFNQEEFNWVVSKTLELLNTPTFDQDADQYFGQFYK